MRMFLSISTRIHSDESEHLQLDSFLVLLRCLAHCVNYFKWNSDFPLVRDKGYE